MELGPSSTIVALLVVTLAPARRRVLLANAFHAPPVRVPEAKLETPEILSVPPFLASAVPSLAKDPMPMARSSVPPETSALRVPRLSIERPAPWTLFGRAHS